jgi:hypothetical protein
VNFGKLFSLQCLPVISITVIDRWWTACQLSITPVAYKKTSKEKAKGIWLCADHFSAENRTKLWLGGPQRRF